jgi:hypothetical protein
MDVKTIFLHEVIKEEVYIEQPQGVKVQSLLLFRVRRS